MRGENRAGMKISGFQGVEKTHTREWRWEEMEEEVISYSGILFFVLFALSPVLCLAFVSSVSVRLSGALLSSSLCVNVSFFLSFSFSVN